MGVQTLIRKFSSTPKCLFLIDGGGALLSAVFLGLVFPTYQALIGMPRATLYKLAFFPSLFGLYDLLCYATLTQNWAPYLRGIGLANLLYSFVSVGMLIYHYPRLTQLGIGYFSLELVLILLLVVLELGLAAKLSLQG